MRTLLAVAAVAILLSGCELVGLGGPRGGSYPAACAEFQFPAPRCAAIVEQARDEAAIEKERITGIELLPPPQAGGVQLGGMMMAQVRFSLKDGPTVTQEVWCKTVLEDNRACNDDPQLMLLAGIDHDVPCAGEPPAGCATLPPTPGPAAVAAARPLRIAALDIPLDAIGNHEVIVGDAGLPNGYLSRREFRVAELRPTTFWISGGILLEVRSTVPGRPVARGNYRDPFTGTEPVEVVLVFKVTETTPGAVLQIRDLVVQ